MTEYPLLFRMKARGGYPLFFRVEIFRENEIVAIANELEDESGWSKTISPEPDVVATLALRQNLPNGAYKWRATVTDGYAAASTPFQNFNVNLSTEWGIAYTNPQTILANPNVPQSISVIGMGIQPTAQVWLEQTHDNGEVERFNPDTVQRISEEKIDFSANFINRSGLWDVVISQNGQKRYAKLFVLPYLPLMEFTYENPEVFAVNRKMRHTIRVSNEGSADGVAVVGIKPPKHVLYQGCNGCEFIGRIGEIRLIAVSVPAGEEKTIAVFYYLETDFLNEPGQPVDPNKYNLNDEVRFRAWLIAQPSKEAWNLLQSEASSLEDKILGAVWASAFVEGWALDKYFNHENQQLAGEYIERLGYYYPYLADALVSRQTFDLDLLFKAALSNEMGGEAFVNDLEDYQNMSLEAADFSEWLNRQVGDPWEFLKAFFTGFDDTIASGQAGAFLIAEVEGFVEGLSFGLLKPNLGAATYAHINGLESGAIKIGHSLGNFLSIPIGWSGQGKLWGGAGNMLRKSAQEVKKIGDINLWNKLKLTLAGVDAEPYRLGISMLHKGADKPLIHYGYSPKFGGWHWGLGWSADTIKNGGQTLVADGFVLYGAGPHIYTNHLFIPWKWKGKMIGEIDISLFRKDLAILSQGSAAIWREGKGLEHLVVPPAPYQDKTICGMGASKIAASWDPNAIDGLPNRSHIHPHQPLELTIYFENLAQANLPAETVVITLPVTANLDWESLQLLGTSHPEKLSIKADRNRRLLIWTFNDIQLPPNQNPPEGEGWVRLAVKPRLDLQTGEWITARADIRFDANPVIQTNEISFTIDLKGPASTFEITKVEDNRVILSAQATDNAGGSGVMSILAQYSTDQNTWYDGQAITTTVPISSLTGTITLSLPGGKYYIRVIAADDLGNVGLPSAVREVNLPRKLYLPLILR